MSNTATGVSPPVAVAASSSAKDRTPGESSKNKGKGDGKHQTKTPSSVHSASSQTRGKASSAEQIKSDVGKKGTSKGSSEKSHNGGKATTTTTTAASKKNPFTNYDAGVFETTIIVSFHMLVFSMLQVLPRSKIIRQLHEKMREWESALATRHSEVHAERMICMFAYYTIVYKYDQLLYDGDMAYANHIVQNEPACIEQSIQSVARAMAAAHVPINDVGTYRPGHILFWVQGWITFWQDVDSWTLDLEARCKDVRSYKVAENEWKQFKGLVCTTRQYAQIYVEQAIPVYRLRWTALPQVLTIMGQTSTMDTSNPGAFGEHLVRLKATFDSNEFMGRTTSFIMPPLDHLTSFWKKFLSPTMSDRPTVLPTLDQIVDGCLYRFRHNACTFEKNVIVFEKGKRGTGTHIPANVYRAQLAKESSVASTSSKESAGSPSPASPPPPISSPATPAPHVPHLSSSIAASADPSRIPKENEKEKNKHKQTESKAVQLDVDVSANADGGDSKRVKGDKERDDLATTKSATNKQSSIQDEVSSMAVPNTTTMPNDDKLQSQPVGVPPIANSSGPPPPPANLTELGGSFAMGAETVMMNTHFTFAGAGTGNGNAVSTTTGGMGMIQSPHASLTSSSALSSSMEIDAAAARVADGGGGGFVYVPPSAVLAAGNRGGIDTLGSAVGGSSSAASSANFSHVW